MHDTNKVRIVEGRDKLALFRCRRACYGYAWKRVAVAYRVVYIAGEALGSCSPWLPTKRHAMRYAIVRDEATNGY